jgi:hypothetical protein
MSITAITLGDSYQSSYEGLKTLFQTYGSAYFNNITYDDTNYAINCYITVGGDDPEDVPESICFLRIVTEQTPLSITVTTRYGVTRTFTVAQRYLRDAYIVSGGITFAADNNSVPSFTICKDKGGHTVLIYSENLNIGNTVGNTANVVTVNINTSTYTLSNIYQTVAIPGRGDLVRTSLSPIIISGNDGDYTEDVLFINAAQFVMSGNYARTWVVDEVNYFSNGLWVVKDE